MNSLQRSISLQLPKSKEAPVYNNIPSHNNQKKESHPHMKRSKSSVSKYFQGRLLNIFEKSNKIDINEISKDNIDRINQQQADNLNQRGIHETAEYQKVEEENHQNFTSKSRRQDAPSPIEISLDFNTVLEPVSDDQAVYQRKYYSPLLTKRIKKISKQSGMKSLRSDRKDLYNSNTTIATQSTSASMRSKSSKGGSNLSRTDSIGFTGLKPLHIKTSNRSSSVVSTDSASVCRTFNWTSSDFKKVKEGGTQADSSGYTGSIGSTSHTYNLSNADNCTFPQLPTQRCSTLTSGTHAVKTLLSLQRSRSMNNDNDNYNNKSYNRKYKPKAMNKSDMIRSESSASGMTRFELFGLGSCTGKQLDPKNTGIVDYPVSPVMKPREAVPFEFTEFTKKNVRASNNNTRIGLGNKSKSFLLDNRKSREEKITFFQTQPCMYGVEPLGIDNCVEIQRTQSTYYSKTSSIDIEERLEKNKKNRKKQQSIMKMQTSRGDFASGSIPEGLCALDESNQALNDLDLENSSNIILDRTKRTAKDKYNRYALYSMSNNNLKIMETFNSLDDVHYAQRNKICAEKEQENLHEKESSLDVKESSLNLSGSKLINRKSRRHMSDAEKLTQKSYRDRWQRRDSHSAFNIYNSNPVINQPISLANGPARASQRTFSFKQTSIHKSMENLKYSIPKTASKLPAKAKNALTPKMTRRSYTVTAVKSKKEENRQEMYDSDKVIGSGGKSSCRPKLYIYKNELRQTDHQNHTEKMDNVKLNAQFKPSETRLTRKYTPKFEEINLFRQEQKAEKINKQKNCKGGKGKFGEVIEQFKQIF